VFLTIVILILSAALCMFYLRTACEAILRRRLNQQSCDSAVEANGLQFPFVRKAVEDFGVPVDYERLRMQVKGDFVALTHLLARNARRTSRPGWVYLEERLEEREVSLLTMYFRAVSLALVIVHALRLNERAAFLKLTKILEYFANVLDYRLGTIYMIRPG